MRKLTSILVGFLLACNFLQAQIPTRPNQFDADSLRTGMWVILYDSAYQNKTNSPDSAHYYCLINFEKGKPKGRVSCFFKSGIKQWDGKLLKLDPDLKHGKATFYYPLGNVQEVVYYANDTLNGPYVGYYEDGKLNAKGTFKNNKKEGYWEFYYPNGNPSQKGTYQEDNVYGEYAFYHENGQLHSKGLIENNEYQGPWKFHYDNGQVEFEVAFEDNLRIGKYVAYHRNGQLQGEAFYVKGKREGKGAYYHENGKVSEVGQFGNDLYQGVWQFYDEDGRIASTRTYVDDKENGYVKHYHPNGQVRVEGIVKNNNWNDSTTYYYASGIIQSKGIQAEGRYEGEWVTNWENGNLQTIKNYVNDTLHGMWERYLENGQLNERGLLDKDRLQGPWEVYYANGNLKSKGPYKLGQRNGYFEFYGENGLVETKCEYFGEVKNGECEFYWDNGNLKSKGIYDNGKRRGPWSFYHENGQLKSYGIYVDGKSEGHWKYYHDDGSLKCEGEESMDMAQGPWEYYYRNGNKKSEGVFVNNDREGIWKYYHENGQLNYSGNTSNGDGIGIWIYYDSLGRKTSEGRWEDDLRDSTWVYFDSLGRIESTGDYIGGKKVGKWWAYKDGKKDFFNVYDRGTKFDFWNLQDSSLSLARRRQLDSALTTAAIAKKIWKKNFDPDIRNYHSFYGLMGDLYQYTGKYDKALKFYNKALQEINRVETDTSWNYSIILNDLAHVYDNMGEQEKAVETYRRSLAILLLNHDYRNTQSYYTVLESLSNELSWIGQNEEGMALLQEELAYRLTMDSVDHRVVSRIYKQIGVRQYDNGDYLEARNSFAKYFEYIQNNNLIDPSEEYVADRYLGLVFNKLYEYDSAVMSFKNSIANIKKHQLYNTSSFIYNYLSIANKYYRENRYQQTRIWADSAHYFCKLHGYDFDERYINVLNTQARARLGLYQYQEAIDLYKEAIGLNQRSERTDLSELSLSYQGLAICYDEFMPEKQHLIEETYRAGLDIYAGHKGYSFQYTNARLLFIQFLQDNKRIAQADKEIRALLTYRLQYPNKRDDYLCRIYRKMGSLAFGQYQYDSALQYYDLSLVEARRVHSPIYEARAYNSKANIYENLYKNEEAEKYMIQALNLLREAYGDEHRDYLKQMVEMGIYYRRTGNTENALVYFNKVLNIKERVYGKNSKQYVDALSSVYETYVYDKDLKNASKIGLELEPLILSVNSRNSGSYLNYLDTKMEFLRVQRKYKETEALIRELLTLSEKINGYLSESHAYYLREAGKIYQGRGKYQQALSLVKQAAFNVANSIGTKNVKYAWYAKSLADLSFSMENYRDALNYMSEAIDIYEHVYGSTAETTIDAQMQMAGLYRMLGRYEDAEQLLIQCRKQYRELFREPTISESQAIEQLAVVYRWWGNTEKAIESALGTIQYLDDLEDTHISWYLDSYNMLGLSYLDNGQLDEAEKYLSMAREKAENQWGAKNYRYQTFTNNLAFVYMERGEFKTSEKLMLEAGQRFKESENVLAIDLANYEDNLAALYLAWGKMDEAENYWTHVCELLLGKVNSSFEYMSESEKSNFWYAYGKSFEYFNSYAIKAAPTKPKAIGQMYDNQLRTKGILLSSSTKERRRIINSGDSVLVGKYFEYIDLKEQLGRYYTYTSEQILAENINLDSLEKISNNLEKQLSIDATALAKEERAKKVRWQNIQRKLKSNEAVVEMIRFRYFDRHVTDSVIYAAMILTDKTVKSPDLVILPNGNELEKKYLKNYLTSIRFKVDDQYSYDQFWKAIDEKLGSKNVVYFSPDGVFNQINVSTIRKPDGGFLLDDYNLHILTSSRDFMLLEKETRQQLQPAVAALFGFPQYDLDHASIGEYVEERALTRSRTLERDLDLERFGFTELPGTKTETESIEQILVSNDWNANLYIGHEALEERLKSIHNPEILHIATHGFFLEDKDSELSAKLGVNTEQGRQNPLLRSGLLLAGAAQTADGNHSSNTENGIFTAYEAMNLDLNDTELVVLSACETGKGEVKSGEGVYGLQRAFQVAGTKALVMSLWKVNDEATQMLMTNFYSSWIGGMSKTDAFKSAQQTVRSQFKDPYYWGAFVLVGQ